MTQELPETHLINHLPQELQAGQHLLPERFRKSLGVSMNPDAKANAGSTWKPTIRQLRF